MLYYVESELPPKAYLNTLRKKFTTPFALYSERVTGVIIGPFFSIAYYNGFEWNRKITNECTRAFGRVMTVDGKTKVYFYYSKGLLSLSWILLFFALGMLMGWAYGLGIIWRLVTSLVFAFLFCGYTAFADSLTEAGAQGAGVLTSLLEKPEEFFYC